MNMERRFLVFDEGVFNPRAQHEHKGYNACVASTRSSTHLKQHFVMSKGRTNSKRRTNILSALKNLGISISESSESARESFFVHA